MEGPTSVSSSALLIVIMVLLVIVTPLFNRRRTPLLHLPLPPGPSGLPFIGNVSSMPSTHAWITYAQWAKTYGDVLHVHVFGKSLIILNSLDAAQDILEKKSSVTSDRPRFVMISDLMGWDWAVQFMSPGPRFRHSRKMLHQLLHAQAARSYWPAIQKGVRSLLKDLLAHPGSITHHLEYHSGSIMMSLIYGVDEGPIRDRYVAMAEDALSGLVEAGNIGKFLVDFLPILRFVPSWCPGASFQRQAQMWRQMARDMIEIPYKDFQQAYAAGIASPSIMRTLREQQKQGDQDAPEEELVIGVGGVLYVGGADTSLSALGSFVLAMLLHPDQQKRAQAEIDSVVGQDRLPEPSDRASLPYVDCIMSEVLRWSPGVPLGVPHRCEEDLEYRGFRIPAGSTILVNQWSILHDSRHYAEPFSFIPERFLAEPKSSILDPRDASFGFGRRVCPGRHFADDLLWMVIVNTLAAFDILKAEDAQGNPIEPSGTFINGLVTRPEPFECRLLPRSGFSEHLVE